MKKHLKKILVLILMACSTMVFAQSGQPVEMADEMRSNGKIYIVVAVCLTILIGLFLYVWSVDRKVSSLERSSKD